MTAVLVRRAWVDWPQLWTDPIHDRSAHLDVGVQLGADLRHLRVVDFLRDVHSFRSWPPLHDGLLVGLALLVSGFEPQAAILPSALAFVATVMVASMLAQALVPTSSHRSAAWFGALAGGAVLASPAMRAFATDVMIEAPGAALTLVVLLTAVRFIQARASHEGEVRRARHLAWALSALFFTKYNYWTVAVLACAPVWWPWVRGVGRPLSVRTPRSARARLEVGGAVAAVAVVVGLVGVSAGDGFLGTRAVWTATIAAWVIAAVLAVWTRAAGRTWLADHADARELVRWHVLPVVVWFCLPGKLQGFLWFQVPLTNQGERPSNDLVAASRTYASAFARDYHPSVGAAILAAALAVGGIVAWQRRRLAPGAGMVVAFVLLSIMLLLPHPNQKSRFVHTVAPAVWVLGAAGLAVLASDRDRRQRVAAWSMAVVVVVGVTTALPADAHAPEGGLQRHRPSLLPVVDTYLADVLAADRPMVIADVPMRFLVRWTHRVAVPASSAIETEADIDGFDVAATSAVGRRANDQAVERWLDRVPGRAPVDLVVVVRLGPSTPWYVRAPGNDALDQLVDVMGDREDFVVETRRVRPGRRAGAATDADTGAAAVVEIWTRRP